MEDDNDTISSTEDDPVVNEIPIYLSKRLENNLYLFQYPLKPKSSHQKMNIKKAFFKPKNQEVKVEMAVDPTSKNFDLLKAEQLAKEIDGATEANKSDNDVVFENEIVDKVILTSTKVVKEPAKYSIGVYNGREFHITPLSGFVQMRPSFSHMDKAVKRKRDANTSNADSEDEAEGGPQNAQQVTVKFARDDKTKKNVEATSYKKLQEKSKEEAWVECQWQDVESAYSAVQKEKLFAGNLTDSTHNMNMAHTDYIRLLIPEDKEQAQIKPSLPSNVISLHALRELPVLEQCKLLLKDAKIIQFQQLLLLLGGVEVLSPELLLNELSQVAVVVRGNWIVKSEILYPSNTHSAVSGVPSELMCRARDYVLYLFTKNQCIERKKISSVIRIPPDEIKEILTGISKLHHNKVWELLLPVDVDFVTKYPDVALRQNLLWQQRANQLNEYFTDSKEKSKRRKSKSVSEDSKTRKDSIMSDSESGSEKNKSPHLSRKANKIKVEQT